MILLGGHGKYYEKGIIRIAYIEKKRRNIQDKLINANKNCRRTVYTNFR